MTSPAYYEYNPHLLSWKTKAKYGMGLRFHEGFYFQASCQPIDRKVF